MTIGLFYTAMTISGFFNGIPPGLYALIGTLFGGVVLKFVEGWLTRNKDKSAERRDLHGEIKDLQTRLDSVESEVTFWRNRFYEEQEDNATLRVLMVKAGLTPPLKRVQPPEA